LVIKQYNSILYLSLSEHNKKPEGGIVSFGYHATFLCVIYGKRYKGYNQNRGFAGLGKSEGGGYFGSMERTA
jgi:hypothetical protein